MGGRDVKHRKWSPMLSSELGLSKVVLQLPQGTQRGLQLSNQVQEYHPCIPRVSPQSHSDITQKVDIVNSLGFLVSSPMSTLSITTHDLDSMSQRLEGLYLIKLIYQLIELPQFQVDILKPFYNPFPMVSIRFLVHKCISYLLQSRFEACLEKKFQNV